MNEPKDYVIRLMKKLVEFMARITGLISTRHYREAETLLNQELHDLTGLPTEVLEQADGPFLSHMMALQEHPEKVLAVTSIYYHKGLVTEALGDPIEARRLFLIADHYLKLIKESFFEQELQNMYVKLCKDLAYQLS